MKKTVFGIIVGVVVGTITTVLASSYLASNIAYTPKNKAWKVDNVEAAIDSLMLSKTETNYSSEERVVGTWINGKPLYQKTIIINNPIYGTSWNNVSFSSAGIENPETFVDISGMIFGGSADPNYYSIYSYRPGMENGVVVAIETANNRFVYMNNWISNSSNGGKMYITVQYTKTTDSAN